MIPTVTNRSRRLFVVKENPYIGVALRTALLGVSALVLTAHPARAATWDMPLAYAASNYHSKNAAKFAKMVKRNSGGKIEIVTHPGGSLFKGGEIFRAIRTGQAPIGERLISALGNESPLFEIDALPFLATSFEEAMKLHIASLPVLRKILAGKRVRMLYTVPWPPQGLYNETPVRTLADMKGVRFRASNAATARLATLMGAIPTIVEAAEITQAFATGVAQSMISSSSTGYDRKIWEHVKYWYDTQAWLPKNMVIVNAKAWDGLDDAGRAAISKAAAAAEKAGWAGARRLADWYKVQLAKNGMTVEKPNPELASQFRALGNTMMTEWLKRAGAEGKAVIAAYKAMN